MRGLNKAPAFQPGVPDVDVVPDVDDAWVQQSPHVSTGGARCVMVPDVDDAWVQQSPRVSTGGARCVMVPDRDGALCGCFSYPTRANQRLNGSAFGEGMD